VFRSFFPRPSVFFPVALLWIAFCMLAWFPTIPSGWTEYTLLHLITVPGPDWSAATSLADYLKPYISLGPLLGIAPTEANPEPFFSADRVWLYQYVLMSGYLFCIPWLFVNDNRRWYWWSVVGSVTIIEFVYFNVQINAWLNDWYGSFYNMIQEALTTPNSVTLEEYFAQILTVAVVLVPAITAQVLNLFFDAHYVFRWRRAMNFYYMANWQKIRKIEGASQRVQEDTQNFSSIIENLGLSIIDSVMTLLVFLPLLWGLSQNITELPWIGPVNGSLVWVALVSAIFGTTLLAVVGVKLPGLQFANQRVEAAYRKELVFGEDTPVRARPPTVRELFRNVQKNYFRIYLHYTYFNVARYAYLQGAVFVPYVAMGPSIVGAAITLGLFQQILQAFGQVSDSFRFLVNSWTTIINLISIHQRLRGFEMQIPLEGKVYANDYDDPKYLATEAEFPAPSPDDPVPGLPTETRTPPLWPTLGPNSKMPMILYAIGAGFLIIVILSLVDFYAAGERGVPVIQLVLLVIGAIFGLWGRAVAVRIRNRRRNDAADPVI
jgi:peptide/bleomycin uptake transporter